MKLKQYDYSHCHPLLLNLTADISVILKSMFLFAFLVLCYSKLGICPVILFVFRLIKCNCITHVSNLLFGEISSLTISEVKYLH